MRGAFPDNATQVAPDDLQGIIAAAVTENIVPASANLAATSPGPLANGGPLLWSPANGAVQPAGRIPATSSLLSLSATQNPSWRKQFQLGKEKGINARLKSA